MPVVRDFRNYSYDRKRIDRCGRFMAKTLYAKLFAIENVLRIVIHSVLTAQLAANWWPLAASPDQQKLAVRFKQHYLKNPQHTLAGNHELYYIFLSDLTEILRVNRHHFLPIVSDVDQWLLQLDGIRVPRNLVGHMNFLNAADRQRIESVFAGLPNLVAQVQQSTVIVTIPS